MTRAKIEELENRLFDKITLFNNRESLYNQEAEKLGEDIRFLIDAINVIKMPISNPVITKNKD